MLTKWRISCLENGFLPHQTSRRLKGGILIWKQKCNWISFITGEKSWGKLDFNMGTHACDVWFWLLALFRSVGT